LEKSVSKAKDLLPDQACVNYLNQHLIEILINLPE